MTQNSQLKSSTASLTAPAPDRFMQTLRQTLEHVDDSDWLNKHSPLASVFFAGASTTGVRRRQIVLTGLQEIDYRLRTTWHAWEERTKTPLQSVLWEAVCHLPPDLDTHMQAILLLTYFEEPRPKQSEVIRLLALGRSTYYRYLERAIETLSISLIHALRPALRLEQPKPRPLVGRNSQLAQAQAGLAAGRVVHVIGGGGLGKTSLSAHLADQWRRGGVFWYTFRRGLTDHLDQLLFTLAYFLHEQGVSGLWLYLNSNPEEMSSAKAMTALRQHLLELQETPPLLCFDEVDLLLPTDLQDSAEHVQLRAFLEDLAHSPRGRIPLLLIGQKLLLEPDPECLLTLTPFTDRDIVALLRSVDITLEPTAQQRLLTLTRGNPLLLRLFLLLHGRGAPLAHTLEMLSAPVTLEWFLLRLREHLTPAEFVVLQELAVFPENAPQDAWRSSRKQLRSLLDLELVDAIGAESVALHPALRELIYRGLPAALRSELHLAAAHLWAERGRFTAAAWHYVEGGCPELAVWTWYTHRQHEIDQGQASAALDLFAPLASAPLPTAEDQRALALLLAPLLARAGRAQEGLTLLEGTTWPATAASTAKAHELRGELLAEVGDVERALAEYRRSLESVAQLRATQEADLHLNIGRRALVYLGDSQQAQQEVMQARLNLEVLQGELADTAGDYAAARVHYTNALTLAERYANDHRLAKIHEALGNLEARYANLDPAIAHLTAAGRHYGAAGNQVCAVGMTNSGLAMAYIIKRRYAEAVPPAETALAFFQELNHTYWMAINETYLAEAWLYLGEIAKAEEFAETALRREEVVVRPYCLFLLGHVRRMQQRYPEAERLCREGIDAGKAMHDPWAQGPAWLALGEVYRDARNYAEAEAAFGQAIQIFEKLGVTQEVDYAQELLAGLKTLPCKESMDH